jgi:hypothetical protein
VLDRVLTPTDRVIAFRVGNESPFKLFYTRAGASPFASGINPVGRVSTGMIPCWGARSPARGLLVRGGARSIHGLSCARSLDLARL